MAEWHMHVKRIVRSIPAGRVMTYGQIAWLVGVPRGARAVGWVLHGLPEGTDVPWHRVINAQGRISNRSSPSAPYEQRNRLEAEGVQFDETDDLRVRDFDAILWQPTSAEIGALLDTDVEPEGN
jgi:methylated-DNA-protein-cysteine methyltransferase related protein